MTFGFFTISTFDLIPICNHISNHFCGQAEDNKVEMYHCVVPGAMEYHKNVRTRNLGSLMRKEIKAQSPWFRLTKYTKLVKGIMLFQLRNRDAVIYTIDLPTLTIVTFFSLLFFTKRTKIIYHQFEIIEPHSMSLFNKAILFFFKSMKGRLSLFIAPEINRLKYFIELTGFSQDRSMLFPNTTYPARANQEEKSNLNGAITIAHVGIAGIDHYINEFLQALSLVKTKQEVRVVFLGYLPDEVIALIESCKLQNVRMLGDLPHKELWKYYSEIDVGVILYRDLGLNYRFCAPNKLYEYWSNGVSIVAHELEGLNGLFGVKNLGLLCNMNDPASIARGLEQVASNVSLQSKAEVREYFNQNLSINSYLTELSTRLQTKL